MMQIGNRKSIVTLYEHSHNPLHSFFSDTQRNLKKGFGSIIPRSSDMVYKEQDLRSTTANRNKRLNCNRIYNPHHRLDFLTLDKQLSIGPILFVVADIVATSQSLRTALYEQFGDGKSVPKFFDDCIKTIRTGQIRQGDIYIQELKLTPEYYSDVETFGLKNTLLDERWLRTDAGMAVLVRFINTCGGDDYFITKSARRIPLDAGKTLSMTAMYNRRDYIDEPENVYLLQGAEQQRNNSLFIINYLNDGRLHDILRDEPASVFASTQMFEVNRITRNIGVSHELIVHFGLTGIYEGPDEQLSESNPTQGNPSPTPNHSKGSTSRKQRRNTNVGQGQLTQQQEHTFVPDTKPDDAEKAQLTGQFGKIINTLRGRGFNTQDLHGMIT